MVLMQLGTKTHPIILAVALCFTAAAHAAGPMPHPAPHAPLQPLTRDQYKAAKAHLDAQGDAERKACDRSRGNARDVCMATAKARDKIARAELDARYKPGPNADRDAKLAQADANYDVAKVRCSALKDGARDRCVAQAKATRESEIRMAKVRKVEEIAELKARKEDVKKGVAKPESPAQRYAALKSRCELLGTERDHCLDDLKRRYGKT